LASGGVEAFAKVVAPPATQPANFAKKTLGKTGLKVTVVSFGAIRLRPPTGARLLRMGIDAGINLVHTSHGYGDGKSVAAIGQLFAQDKSYRDKVVLCLKCGWDADEKYLDRYLKLLHTDHADVYLPQLHWPRKDRMEKALASLERLKKKGKIRFGGFTCHESMNEVCEMILAEAPKGYDACLISTKMLRASAVGISKKEQAQRFARNLQELRKNGVGIISMKSGARRLVERDGEAFGSHVRALVGAGVDTVLTTLGSIRSIENAAQAGLNRLAVTAKDRTAWQQPDPDEWPCMMCGQCTEACPAGVPVAGVMRLELYHKYYRMPDQARTELAEMQIDAATAMNLCTGCGSCSGACPVGLASGRKVAEILGALA